MDGESVSGQHQSSQELLVENENTSSGMASDLGSFINTFGHLRNNSSFADTAVVADVIEETKTERESAPILQVSGSQRHVVTALAHARAKTMMLASTRQRGNPMLKHVRHVSVAFDSSIVPDFVCGTTTAVLYLSLQYHSLHPEYVYVRVRGLGRAYKLRVLLILVDVHEHRQPMQELTKLSVIHDLTLICASSEREAARYCETLRSYSNKTADSIQEQVKEDHASRISAVLGSVRGINKTDVSTLAFNFGPLKNIASASEEQLRRCPGMGDRKVARLFTAMNQPFSSDQSWSRRSGDVEEADE